MSHTPPVPHGNVSTYPITAPPAPKTPPPMMRAKPARAARSRGPVGIAAGVSALFAAGALYAWKRSREGRG